MERRWVRRAIAAAAVATGAAGCGSNGGGASDDGKLAVLGSFYPVAEAARRVGGDHVTVANLTPAGVEPHDLELTSDDVDAIDNAAVVFYAGAVFQPGVAEAAERRDGPSVDVVAGVLPRARYEVDPHFWLDPTLMAKAVDVVENALAKADPTHDDAFRANADAYKAELAALDAEYRSTLAGCERTEIVTAHGAFAYLALQYGLTQVAITGVSPESEPDPQRIAELADLVKRDGVTTVFYEELVPRDFADALAKEADVRTDVLNPLEGLSKADMNRGEDYTSVMLRNLRALSNALGCQVHAT